MTTCAPRLEAFIGRLLINQRGRDAKLFTCASASTNMHPPIMNVTTPLDPSLLALLPEHTPSAENGFPVLSWSLPADIGPGQVKSYTLIIEDPDAPLSSPVVHGLYYGLPAGKTSVQNEDFAIEGGVGTGADSLSGGFREGGN